MGSRRALLLLQTLLCLPLGCNQAPTTAEESHLLVVRARALFESGEAKGAEKLLRRVAEADPKPDSHANLAWVQWSRGHRKDAVRSWHAALDLDPTHERSLYALTLCELQELQENRSDPRADPAARQAVRALADRTSQAGAGNAAIQNLLAQVARAMGDTSVALTAQREAERLDPGRAGTVASVYGLEGIRLPVLRQTSSRIRTPPRFMPIPGGQRATAVFPVDLDGDGRLDLILGGSIFVSWSDADSGNSNLLWHTMRLLDEPITQICTSLFDSDGLLDVVAFTQHGDSLVSSKTSRHSPPPVRTRSTGVWLIRGGSRSPRTSMLFDLASEVRGARALDADWDGDVDVVVALSEAPGLQLLRNDGAGGFDVAPLPGCAEFGPARGLASADVDGDGRDDLIVLDMYGRVRIFGARASGVFANLSPRTGLGLQRARALEAADLDDDGDVDLILGDDEGLWIWANEGAAGFRRVAAYRDALADWSAQDARGVPVAAIHLTDLDNDGLLDLVTQHFDASPEIFAAAAQAPEGSEDTAPGTRRLEPLRAIPARTRLAVWHNEDNMLFADVTAASGCGDRLVAATSAGSGDFNGDGAVDLVVAGADSTLLFLWSHGGSVHRRLMLELEDARRPAACIGARVELYLGAQTVVRTMRAPVVKLGIQDAEIADVLRVSWPDGSVENRFDVALPLEGTLRLTRGR